MPHPEYPFILGVVGTARHVINHENGSDNTLCQYFSLSNKLDTNEEKNFLLIAIQKKSQEEIKVLQEN